MENEEKYRAFYFQKAEPKNRINNHSGIILLHNSWTPKIYRKMTAKRLDRMIIFFLNRLKLLMVKNKKPVCIFSQRLQTLFQKIKVLKMVIL